MKRGEREVLIQMINTLLLYLEELSEYKDEEGEQFQYGERTAYTECLEMIQTWSEADRYGLNFDIEEKYTL